MTLRRKKGTTPTSRFESTLDNFEITKTEPSKSLIEILPKKSGRNLEGKITTRHQGKREKRFYRIIDWRKDKKNISAKVAAIEYDPNRTANIALLHYIDGEKRYTLAPKGTKVGDIVTTGTDEVKAGNSLPLSQVPIGTLVHNIELVPGRGGKMVRSAGTSAVILAKEEGHVTVKLPSGEIRKIDRNCLATIGEVSNPDWKNVVFGKAGRKIHMGIRPTVRGTAQNPRTHPHGGGEGRSGEGMNPKTPWGKSARGKKTRKKSKYSDKFIVQRRKKS